MAKVPAFDSISGTATFGGQERHVFPLNINIGNTGKLKTAGISMNVTATGGKGLKAHISAMSETAKTKGYDIGWGGNDRYQHGGDSGGTINASMVAKYTEFGFFNVMFGSQVVPREFFRKSNEIFHRKLVIQLPIYARANHIRRKRGGNYNLTPTQVNELGTAHANEVRNTLVNRGNIFARNKPMTIKNKGVAKNPLTDTGFLAATVTHEVKARGAR